MRRRTPRRFLEEKLAQTKARLEDSERTLVDFQREQQIINVDDKQTILAQTMNEFNLARCEGGAGTPQGRIAVQPVQRESRDFAPGARRQVGPDAQGAARQDAGGLPGHAQDLQAWFPQDAAARRRHRRARQERSRKRPRSCAGRSRAPIARRSSRKRRSTPASKPPRRTCSTCRIAASSSTSSSAKSTPTASSTTDCSSA